MNYLRELRDRIQDASYGKGLALLCGLGAVGIFLFIDKKNRDFNGASLEINRMNMIMVLQVLVLMLILYLAKM